MAKLVKIEVYDYATQTVVEVEVNREVAKCYQRTGWNIHDSNESFNLHNICFTDLKGGEDDAYENFNEFICRSFNPYHEMDDKEEYSEMMNVLPYLSEAINTLTTAQREVIEALFYRNLTQEEYAKEKGIAQGTVAINKKRAIKNLKKYFSKKRQ